MFDTIFEMLNYHVDRMASYVRSNSMFVAWVFAITAMLVSLSLSEVWGFVPCKLCWYQRYLLISTIAILSVAEFKKRYTWHKYVLPLTLIGAVIAFYQTLLQWGFIQETLSCAIDAPCALAQINWFGFITIPFMSLMVFVVLSSLLILHHKQIVTETPKK